MNIVFSWLFANSTFSVLFEIKKKWVVHSITGNFTRILDLNILEKLIQRWLCFGDQNSKPHFKSNYRAINLNCVFFNSFSRKENLILVHNFSNSFVHIKYRFKYWYLISHQGLDYLIPLCYWLLFWLVLNMICSWVLLFLFTNILVSMFLTSVIALMCKWSFILGDKFTAVGDAEGVRSLWIQRNVCQV